MQVQSLGGFSRIAAAFSSYDGDLSLPLGLALVSPILPSGCEGKLGVALEPLRFVLRQQCPCTFGAGESGLVLSEEGNPAGLSRHRIPRLSEAPWEVP